MESSVHPSVDFFLGATTPAGFKGYFAPLRREPGMQLVLLKSGPGCGKSTLMKRLARAAQDKGEPIQRIHCGRNAPSSTPPRPMWWSRKPPAQTSGC